MKYAILRLPDVLKARGRSKTSHYEDIEAGLFTKPVPLGGHAVGWPEYEVEAINAARIAGKTEPEIVALVTRLEAARASAA
ncbi:MAG: putative transcriptional regulator [Holophagaceae bacterium]|nr:putative transcriptional regulator [Holophagaceae bacterium]